MSSLSTLALRRGRLRLVAGGLLVILSGACSDDQMGPSSAAAPDPTVSAAVLDTRSRLSGIVFGTFSMSNSYLNSVHTGWMQGGALSPSNIISVLSGARARGGRAVIKLSKGHDRFVKNSNGTFSLAKWKSLVGGFRNVNLNPYIADGTIVGHYLIDEPHRTARWGGQTISPATLEAMAAYSKQLWPGMTTMVRAEPTWLASGNYTHLDAGWAQYARGKGDAAKWIAGQAAAAQREGLGLAVGLNVLDGGDGSSRIAGWTRGKYAMSATEVRNYGTALLSHSYSCAFFMWMHDSDYYGRSDIKSAMAALSSKARSHAKTSCRQ
jgi:hypothetical protein